MSTYTSACLEFCFCWHWPFKLLCRSNFGKHFFLLVGFSLSVASLFSAVARLGHQTFPVRACGVLALQAAGSLCTVVYLQLRSAFGLQVSTFPQLLATLTLSTKHGYESPVTASWPCYCFGFKDLVYM